MAQKVLKGRVVSDKNEKSAVVVIDYQQQDRRFKKTVKRSKRIMIHDEENKARVGDIVSIRESRPYSAKKRFVLEKIEGKSLVDEE